MIAKPQHEPIPKQCQKHQQKIILICTAQAQNHESSRFLCSKCIKIHELDHADYFVSKEDLFDLEPFEQELQDIQCKSSDIPDDLKAQKKTFIQQLVSDLENFCKDQTESFQKKLEKALAVDDEPLNDRKESINKEISQMKEDYSQNRDIERYIQEYYNVRNGIDGYKTKVELVQQEIKQNKHDPRTQIGDETIQDAKRQIQNSIAKLLDKVALTERSENMLGFYLTHFFGQGGRKLNDSGSEAIVVDLVNGYYYQVANKQNIFKMDLYTQKRIQIASVNQNADQLVYSTATKILWVLSNDGAVTQVNTGQFLIKHPRKDLMDEFSNHAKIQVTELSDEYGIFLGTDRGLFRISNEFTTEKLDILQFSKIKSIPGTTLVISGTKEGNLYLYDFKAKKILHKVGGHRSAIKSIEYVGFDNTVISACNAGVIIGWKLSQGKLNIVRSIVGFTGLKSLCLLDENYWIIAYENILSIYDQKSEQIKAKKEFEGYIDSVQYDHRHQKLLLSNTKAYYLFGETFK